MLWVFMSVEYPAVKRVYNELREMDAEFAEELRREVATFIGREKRRRITATRHPQK